MQVLNASVGIDPSSVTGTTTIGAYQLAHTWTPSGATWNSRDGSSTWTTPGGDTTGSALGTQALTGSSTGSYQFIDATNLVQRWVTGAAAQDGILLKAAPENTSAGYVCFPTDTGPNGPFLSVYWQSRTGDAPYYTFKTYPIDDHESLKVNVGTGNVMVEGTDDTISGVGEDLQVGRVYNAGAGPYGYWSPVGEGWMVTPGYNTYLYQWADDNSVTYFDPTGVAYTFTSNGSGWTSPPGINADLTTGGAGWKLTFHGGGTVEQFTPDGSLYSITDNNGNTITLHGSPGSEPGQDSITDTEGRTTNFSYNWGSGPGYGYYQTMTDPASRTVQYGYSTAPDGHTLLTSVTDENSQSTRYGYDSNDALTSITTPAGRQISITYTTSTVTVCRSDPNTSTTPCDTYTFTTGSAPRTALQDANGHTTTYTLDASEGKVTKTTDADGRNRSTSYTGNNDTQTVTDNVSNVTTYGYDPQNRLTSLQAPSDTNHDTQAQTKVGYPTVSGSGPYPNSDYWPSAATDPQSNCTSFTYDTAGNLTRSVSGQTPGGNPAACTTSSAQVTTTTNYQGDTGVNCGAKPGEVCSTVDGRNQTTSYSYDTHGNLTQISPPVPLAASTYSVDPTTNLLTSTTDGNGTTTSYFYDGLGHTTEVRYDSGTATTCSATDANAGKCIGYGYDSDGNLTSRIDNTGTTSFFYDGLGRLLEERFDSLNSSTCSTTDANAGKCIAVSYDQAGNITSYLDAGGTVTYTYDPANLLWNLAEPGGSCPTYPTAASIPNTTKCTQFTYDGDGRQNNISYPTGETVAYGYDNSGRINTITQKYANRTTGFTRTITYAKTGADTGLEQSQTDDGTTTSYSYDNLNRLHTATVGSNVYTYHYDADGNMTSSQTPAVGTTYYGVNNADQLCWSGPIPGSNGTTTCPTTPAGDTGYTYDNDGNQKTGGLSFTYNSKNQTTMIINSGTVTSLTYADQGQSLRTSATTSGTTTNEVNGLLGLAGQTVGTGTPIYFTRTPDGQLVGLRQGAGSSFTANYYLTDQQGSVVRVTDSTGNTDVASYRYGEYGDTLSATGGLASVNPYRYASGYYELSNGLEKFGDREYEPALGRFTQEDPKGVGYVYAGDNPANATDPSGDRIDCSSADSCTLIYDFLAFETGKCAYSRDPHTCSGRAIGYFGAIARAEGNTLVSGALNFVAHYLQDAASHAKGCKDDAGATGESLSNFTLKDTGGDEEAAGAAQLIGEVLGCALGVL